MYIPNNFEQNDPDELKAIIQECPFATLITHSSEGLEADHIPFYYKELNNEKGLLQSHISRGNPLWKNLQSNSKALVVFQGPNTYISPNYYPTKQEEGKVVPTWNYISVHVKGTLSFINESDWNLEMINNLTNQHEAGQVKPWSVSDAPDEFIQKMLSGIVGIEIEIESIVGKWKVSQNQPEQNKRGVVEGLSKESETNAVKMAGIVESYAAENY